MTGVISTSLMIWILPVPHHCLILQLAKQWHLKTHWETAAIKTVLMMKTEMIMMEMKVLMMVVVMMMMMLKTGKETKKTKTTCKRRKNITCKQKPRRRLQRLAASNQLTPIIQTIHPVLMMPVFPLNLPQCLMRSYTRVWRILGKIQALCCPLPDRLIFSVWPVYAVAGVSLLCLLPCQVCAELVILYSLFC